MSKRRVSKLLAVIAIAGSTPGLACQRATDAADPAGHVSVQPPGRVASEPPIPPGHPQAPAHPATQPAAADEATAPAPATRELLSSLAALIGISRPRQMPSGAPACGNVAARTPPECIGVRR